MGGPNSDIALGMFDRGVIMVHGKPAVETDTTVFSLLTGQSGMTVKLISLPNLASNFPQQRIMGSSFIYIDIRQP